MKIKKISSNYMPIELKRALKNADDSFSYGFREHHLLPDLPKGYKYASDTGFSVFTQLIGPHQDEYVGMNDEESYAGSVFGIVTGELWFHVGIEAIEMHAGDFVLFDSRIMHSVISEKKWRGVAVQVLRA
jgi:hypothetical protein